MAKKNTLNVERVIISCPFYDGYLDNMPQEAKDKMKEEKPDMYKKIFENKNN